MSLSAAARPSGLKRLLVRMLRPPRRVRPTWPGMFALFGPVLIGGAAVTASNNLLLILMSAGLATVLLSGVMSERNLRGVKVSLRVAGAAYAGERASVEAIFSRPVEAGAAFDLGIREGEGGRLLTRPGRRAALGLLELRLPIASSAARARGGRRFSARGRAELGPLELFTGFPFGLLIKFKDIDAQLSGWVRPRRVALPPLLKRPGRGALEGGAAARQGVGTEIHGLREWEERDPRARIHARRSLALGQELVLETAQEERPVAFIGVYNAPGARAQALERAYEYAQAALLGWEREGFSPGLALLDRALPPERYDREDMELALAQATPASSAGRLAPALWLVPAGAKPPAGTPALYVQDSGALSTEPQ